MNELLLGLAVLVIGPGSLLALWARKKLKLSPEAADAVAPPEGPKPGNHNEALISLAAQVSELRSDLTDHRIYIPQVVGWGRRGWRHVPFEEREPLPEPPKGVAI